MENIDIRWVGETPTESLGRLAAFTEGGKVVGEATYRRSERDPGLTYLSGFFVDQEYRQRGIATDMVHTIFERLGRDCQFVVTISGNLGRLFMDVIAAEAGAPKLLELVDDHWYRPMN